MSGDGRDMSLGSQKALLVQIQGNRTSEPYLLTNVTAEMFLGMRCIKGTYCTQFNTNWRTGRTLYVPVEKILHMTEYESLDAYRDALTHPGA